jgi:NAD(P)-dependent dehydrogenase (short-subunit alcohol dehydrogenase family)
VQKRKRDVIVVIGPGQIGQAIARRVGIGKHVLLADVCQENADAAEEVLGNAGYKRASRRSTRPRARPCTRSSRRPRLWATSQG